MDSNLKIMKNPEKTSNPHKYSNEHPSHKYKVKVTEKQDGGEWKKSNSWKILYTSAALQAVNAGTTNSNKQQSQKPH